MIPSPIIEASPGWSVRLKHALARGPSAVSLVAVLGWDRGGNVRVLQASAPGVFRTFDHTYGTWRERVPLTGGAAVCGVGAGPLWALVATEGPAAVTLRALDTGAVVGTLDTDGDAIGALAASPDGKLAVVQAGRRVFAYALPATQPAVAVAAVAPIAASADGTMFLALAPEGDRLMVARTDGSFVASLACPRGVAVGAADFGADGASVVAGFEDGTLLCWDLASGKTRWRTKPVAGAAAVAALARAPDGRTLYALDADDRLVALSPKGKTRWEQRLSHPIDDAKPPRRGPRQVAVSVPTGGFVAVASPERAARLFRAANGKEIDACNRDRRGGVLALSLDGTLLASGGVDGVVRVADVASGATRWTLEADPAEVTSAEFLPDRPALRTCGRDGFVRVWNVLSGMEEDRWGPWNAAGLRADAALDGSRVLVGYGLALELWSDASVERIVWRSERYLPGSTHWCFSEAESLVLVAAGATDDEGRWALARWSIDARTGRVLELDRRFFAPSFVTLQETWPGPLSLSWNDGRLIVTEEWDERRARSFGGTSFYPRHARFSSDGAWLVAADDMQLDVFALQGEPSRVARVDLSARGERITALAVSSDGAVFAAGTEWGNVLVFERGAQG